MKTKKFSFPVRESKTKVETVEITALAKPMKAYLDIGRHIKEMQELQSKARAQIIIKMGKVKKAEAAGMYATLYEEERRTVDIDGAIARFGVKAMEGLITVKVSEKLRVGVK